jgi:hypothetical protein
MSEQKMKRKILVVEDSDLERALLIEVLMGAGVLWDTSPTYSAP